MSTFRVLVVDDFEPWRHFVSSMLLEKPELLVVGEASDGLEAVQKAQALKPDLILLDIRSPQTEWNRSRPAEYDKSPRPPRSSS